MLQLQRKKAIFPLAEDVNTIKERMLNWGRQFSIFLFLDNNEYDARYAGYECLMAAGCEMALPESADMLNALGQLHESRRDWMFGHICYDFKNTLEPKLRSVHPVRSGFPLYHFFIPKTVCHINREKTEFTIESFEDPDLIYDQITGAPEAGTSNIPALTFKRHMDRDQYLHTLAKLRDHIREGDSYEINFCLEGFSEAACLDPLTVFRALNKLSPAPFAAFYRLNKLSMMCASPERYLKKWGRQLLSQPIKGTARRDADTRKDRMIRDALSADTKERAENIMIVDLVRNDLARVCVPGSVQVDELFGIYSFPQVHQMISTISGTMREGVPFPDAIRYSFPMGSMTGAPKFKVMQLIDDYERSRRELYSGTVGYISPHGDFDFNVVIRSLFYDACSGYLGYQTGGAITYDSNAEKEWEEMRLKAWAMERIFAEKPGSKQV